MLSWINCNTNNTQQIWRIQKMATDFAQLRKSSTKLYDKILEETNKLTQKNYSNKDERFWQPTVGKDGNGYAVIRFLPAPQGEEMPYVQVWNHGFQGPGGWYIENSLTTLGQKDPVSEFNTKLWNRGDEAGKEQARKQKRRLTYISNIYVVDDPSNPDNNGKVFLYRYGKKIFDKIKEAMNPEFEDETAVNPFDLWEGAPLKLKIRKVEGYRNYDKSEFGASAPLSKNEESMETVWSTEYSLQEFVDPKLFKSYDELKEKLDRVLGQEGVSSSAEDLVEESFDEPVASTASTPKEKVAANEDSDEFDFEAFKKLADE